MPALMRSQKSGRVCVLVAAAIACTFAAGCSEIFGPSGPKITVSLGLESPIVPAPTLRVLIDDRLVVVPASQAGTAPTERTIRGPRFGSTPVRVALMSSAGDTLAAVAFSQEFRRGENHWVAGLTGSHRPIGICIGALAAAPLHGSDTDTLFVMYGNIPEGAIC